MSELTVGTIGGLAVNNNIVRVPSGHTLYAPGHVVQVASSSSTTSTAIATTSYVQAGGSALTVTLTPKSTSSKVFVTANVGYYAPTANNGYIAIYRNNSINIAEAGYYVYQAGEFNYGTISFLDSPATTNAVTYSIYARGGTTVQWTINYVDGGGQVRSTITAMEIAQ